jgi:formylglycine-generating enzyme required for sulfatase activity
VCALGAAALLAGCKNADPVFDTELVVESAPTPGASVTLNNQPYGVTPVRVKGLPPGPVLVEVTLEGFKRAYETYTVPDKGSKTVTLTMRQLVGEVTIESEPPNATVYLDQGTPLGVTPLKALKLPEGVHTIEVHRDKYEPMTETIEVKADYKYTKLFTLKARGSRIEVFSTPTAAAIYLNNALQVEKTPSRVPVNPGTYTVGVYRVGYIMGEEVVTVGPAADATVNLILKEGAVPQGMVLIPAGDFIMGTDDKSPDERPKRTLFVESFYIDKYEVTNVEYKEFFETHTYPTGQDEYPITGVTWEQATEFAQLAKRRLPTEVEWEKAARGTDGREYPWSNVWDPELVNFNDGGLNPRALPVGKFRGGASPYGCLDMAGNVYEWTSSWYERYKGNTEIVKEYGQIFKVLRGGSFKTGPFEARCMTRRYDLMTNKRDDYGFRCAADVESVPPARLPGK